MNNARTLTVALLLALAGCNTPMVAPAVDGGVGGDAAPSFVDSGSVSDTGTVGDAGPTLADAGASDPCNAAGTYATTWTADPTNSAACTPPRDTTITLMADGIPMGGTNCPTGCDATCVTTPIDATTCRASVRIETPCGAITFPSTTTADIHVAGDTLEVELAAARDGEMCAYHGVGTRQ